MITATIQQAEQFRVDLETWLPDQDVVLFPPMEYLPFEVMAHSPEVVSQRLAVLERLAKGENLIVVAPAAALYRSLTPHAVFPAVTAHADARDGDRPRCAWLRASRGRVTSASTWWSPRGTSRVRGEIVDFFPSGQRVPPPGGLLGR